MCFEPPRFDPENQPSAEALINAVVNRNLEGVKMMLDAGADVDGGDNKNIPLICAAQQPGENSEKIVQLLIDRGANVNATDPYGLTALMHAAQDGQVETVRILLDSGADFTLKDNHSGRTAEGWAECYAGLVSGDDTDIPAAQAEALRRLRAEAEESLRLLKEAGARRQHQTAVQRQAVLKGRKRPAPKF